MVEFDFRSRSGVTSYAPIGGVAETKVVENRAADPNLMLPPGGPGHRNQSCSKFRESPKSGETPRGVLTGRDQSGPEFHGGSKSGETPKRGGVRDPEPKVMGNLARRANPVRPPRGGVGGLRTKCAGNFPRRINPKFRRGGGSATPKPKLGEI